MSGEHPANTVRENTTSRNPSSQSFSSDYGEDISPLIMAFDAPQTQTSDNSGPSAESPPSNSRFSSTQTLGKRQSSQLSDPSAEPNEVKKPRIDQIDNNDPSHPYIFAHCKNLEHQITSMDLSWGVMWEMARLISVDKLTYVDITTEILAALRGPNSKAGPETVRMFHPDASSDIARGPAFAEEIATKAPWEELEREEIILKTDPYAGLGNSKAFPDWYGGKVVFKGKLLKEGNQYEIRLERPVLGPSCRFTRRFGSKYFIRIKIPNHILHRKNNGLNNFFRKPFIIWGFVFRAFYAKDDTTFFFRTNEFASDSQIFPDHFPGLSLSAFINWHNPLLMNQNQAMTKWAARTALGLSNSVPGPVFLPENIATVDDVISSQGSDMTDGCGYSNCATHRQICQLLSLDHIPTAFQFRLGGAKGMSSQDSELSSDDSEKIWIRPSQIKIKYPLDHYPLDPTFHTAELLRTSYLKTPARLSAETIINLAENGVPAVIFKQLLITELRELVDGLTNWEGPDAMYKLWTTVEQSGAVLFSRRAREAAGESRVRGFGEQLTEDDEDEDEDEGQHFDRDIDQRSTAWWADRISGCPSSLEETVLVLLDSGFTPQTSPVLRDKLKKVGTSKIKSKSSNCHFAVPQSATAFVVPDPYGILGVNEIQVKSSKRDLRGFDGQLTDIILGDVLMTRNPCKLPTDVRKVQAVDHPRLRGFTDVIVCSIQGYRRLIDFLAGGDYDGDRATVFWGVEMVQSFKNADEKFSHEPPGLAFCFSSTDGNERVPQFIERTMNLPPSEKMTIIQTYLLGALRDTSIVGRYSTMHDNAVYKLGYANPRTIRLAYKFCKVLDGAKTGLRIRPETLQEDERDYNNRTLGPLWKSKFKKDKDKNDHDRRNEPYLKRGRKDKFIQDEFIMDTLQRTSSAECDRVLKEMETIFTPLPANFKDPDLARPWDDAVHLSTRGPPEAVASKRRDLSKISIHVQKMLSEHGSLVKAGPAFTKKPIEARQDILRLLSKKFNSAPSISEMETIMDEASLSRLRASYAYIYDGEKKGAGWSRFPWDVALRELCHIKATSLGPSKTVTSGFYERFKLSKKL